MGTYRMGIALVVLFISAIFIGISLLDAYFHHCQSPSVGYRIQKWSRRNPLFSAALLVVLATLVTHFLANPIST